jgi:hypothetical protein
MTEGLKTKKEFILEAARDLAIQKWTAAEIDQLRRKLIADHGEEGKSSTEYIADVLKSMGWKVQLTEREEAEERFEEEFEDILHFRTLQDAEVSLTRLDELLRRFRAHEESAAVDRAIGKAPGRDDFTQPQGGIAEAGREKGNRRMVPYLAGNAGCIFRLA